LKQARVDVPDTITFVTIDFNRESLGSVLEAAGFNPSQKTLFIWEGVTYYLEIESVDTVLRFVNSLEYPETEIAFDYAISITEDNADLYFGVEAFSKTMKEEHANEALLFSIDEGRIKPFLSERGLKMVEHMDNREIEEAFLTDDSGDLIGEITGHFRFAVASRKDQ
jgi:methyltransferase (TIGR00027 family)